METDFCSTDSNKTPRNQFSIHSKNIKTNELNKWQYICLYWENRFYRSPFSLWVVRESTPSPHLSLSWHVSDQTTAHLCVEYNDLFSADGLDISESVFNLNKIFGTTFAEQMVGRKRHYNLIANSYPKLNSNWKQCQTVYPLINGLTTHFAIRFRFAIIFVLLYMLCIIANSRTISFRITSH